MESNILLESGTNELELLEFVVGTKNYGINIAKVSEIMMYSEVTPMPSAPPEVEGVFMPRDKLITVVDLHKVLGMEAQPDERGLLIVCEFNQMDIAFHVTAVRGIQRISWTNIEKPPAVANAQNSGIATGIAKIDGKIILILDFEKIISDINCSAGLDVSGIEHIEVTEKVETDAHIVIAEDSPFLNKLIVDALKKAHFENVSTFANGKDAWDYISSFKGQGNITDSIKVVISDIEMPQMDGHRLTKLIKDDNELKAIKVFLFSSLIDDKMRKKGESVGADEQFSKPQIGGLVKKLTEVLTK